MIVCASLSQALCASLIHCMLVTWQEQYSQARASYWAKKLQSCEGRIKGIIASMNLMLLKGKLYLSLSSFWVRKQVGM